MALSLAASFTTPLAAQEEAEVEEEAAPSPQDEQARAHFVLGRSAYDAGNYDEAIEQFTRAHELSQRSDLLFNLYQAHHRAQHLEQAVGYLERYLTEGSPDDLQRGTLTERLSNMRRELEEQQAQEAREAEEAERRRQEELARTRAEQQSHSMRNAGIAVLSIGAAAGVMFGVFAGLAAKEDGELSDRPCAATATCSGSDVETLRRRTRGADVSAGLAGAGLLTGLIILLVSGGSSSESTDSSVALRPHIDGRNAALTLRGSF